MTDGPDQRRQPPDDLDSRRRLGEALDAYFYGEFARLAEMRGWFISRRGVGRWGWFTSRPGVGRWGCASILAVTCAAAGWSLTRQDLPDVLDLIAVFLYLLGLLATFAIAAGLALAWLGLRAFGPLIRASLDHRARMRLATLLARHETRLPAGRITRESWAAWRNDLESLSRGGHSLQLRAGEWVGLFLALASLGVGTWLAARPNEEPTQLVTALLVGLSLVVAALLMGRANRELYECRLASALKGLLADPRDAEQLAEYPSSLWVDAIGVIGVVLATPSIAVFVVGVVEELSHSC